MSTRVDYYLLDQADPQALTHYTCRLLNKAYLAGLRIFVLTESSTQSRVIDTMLWVSSDANFIPHALADSADAADPLTKICIGHAVADSQLPAGKAGFDMLVNLQNGETLQCTQFNRVAEMVSADEGHKIAARKRFIAWREVGADQNLHQIQLN